MMKTRWARALVNSRFSRGLYGTSKAIVFVYLGALMALESGRTKWGWSMATSTVGWLDDIGQIHRVGDRGHVHGAGYTGCMG